MPDLPNPGADTSADEPAAASSMSQLAPSGTSLEDLYGPAMRIADRRAALRYLEELAVLLAQQAELNGEDALALARSNLGYYAGNFDHATQLRVEELFDAPHPVLGTARNGPRDLAQVFALGQWLGRGRRLDDAPAAGAASLKDGKKSH